MSVNGCDPSELCDLNVIDAKFRNQNIFPVIRRQLSESRVCHEQDKRLRLEGGRGKTHCEGFYM